MHPPLCTPQKRKDRIDADDLRTFLPDLRRLAQYWHRKCQLTGALEPEDLVQQAVAALYSDAAWPENIPQRVFLVWRIRQAATTAARSQASHPMVRDLRTISRLASPDAELERDTNAEAALVWLTRDAWARGDRDCVRILMAWQLGGEAKLDRRSRKIARQRLTRSVARFLAESSPDDDTERDVTASMTRLRGAA